MLSSWHSNNIVLLTTFHAAGLGKGNTGRDNTVFRFTQCVFSDSLFSQWPQICLMPRRAVQSLQDNLGRMGAYPALVGSVYPQKLSVLEQDLVDEVCSGKQPHPLAIATICWRQIVNDVTGSVDFPKQPSRFGINNINSS